MEDLILLSKIPKLTYRFHTISFQNLKRNFSRNKRISEFKHLKGRLCTWEKTSGMINSKMYPSKLTKDEKNLQGLQEKKKIKQLTSEGDFDIRCLKSNIQSKTRE